MLHFITRHSALVPIVTPILSLENIKEINGTEGATTMTSGEGSGVEQESACKLVYSSKTPLI